MLLKACTRTFEIIKGGDQTAVEMENKHLIFHLDGWEEFPEHQATISSSSRVCVCDVLAGVERRRLADLLLPGHRRRGAAVHGVLQQV